MKLSELIKQLREIEKLEGGNIDCGLALMEFGGVIKFNTFRRVYIQYLDMVITMAYKVPEKFIAFE